jgi:hypothetical protein
MDSQERGRRRIDDPTGPQLPSSDEVERAIKKAREIIEEAKTLSEGARERRTRPPHRAIPMQDE